MYYILYIYIYIYIEREREKEREIHVCGKHMRSTHHVPQYKHTARASRTKPPWP